MSPETVTIQQGMTESESQSNPQTLNQAGYQMGPHATSCNCSFFKRSQPVSGLVLRGQLSYPVLPKPSELHQIF